MRETCSYRRSKDLAWALKLGCVFLIIFYYYCIDNIQSQADIINTISTNDALEHRASLSSCASLVENVCYSLLRIIRQVITFFTA